MASPEHIDEQKPALKQISTADEEKRSWLKPLKRVLGVVLPLVGGFASIWVFVYVLIDNWLLGLFGALLLGAVGALLFRSWWAILIVPLALLVGELLAAYMVPVVYSPDPFAVDDVGFGIALNVIVGTILALIGVFVSTVVYKVREM